jgi:hypothetical protein
MKIILTNLLLLFSTLIFAQKLDNLDWKTLYPGISIAILEENSFLELSKQDSIQIQLFDAKVKNYQNVSELDPSEIGEKIPYEFDFINEIEIFKLHKNSSYLIELNLQIDILQLEIFLKDDLNEIAINQLHIELEREFGKNNIKYISKEEAHKLALTLIDFPNDIFEENIFPASFKIELPNIPENRLKMDNWVRENQTNEYIDEILPNTHFLGKTYIKIKT